MRKLYFMIIILLFSIINSSILSQNKTGTPPPTNPVSPVESSKKTSQDKTKKDDIITESIPDGFKDLGWGTKITDAKDKVIGKIIFSNEKDTIISKDGEIEYKYGFFNIEPTISMNIKAEDLNNAKKDKSYADINKTGLFYVSVHFPSLVMQKVKEKIENKYGTPSGERLENNQGLIYWDSEKTTILLWVDRYKKKSFSRKINYIGKEISKEINAYKNIIFNKTEIEILKRLSP